MSRNIISSRLEGGECRIQYEIIQRPGFIQDQIEDASNALDVLGVTSGGASSDIKGALFSKLINRTVYIRLKDGLPYIGKSQHGFGGRYTGKKGVINKKTGEDYGQIREDGPLISIEGLEDNDLMTGIEQVLLNLNGGKRSPLNANDRNPLGRDSKAKREKYNELTTRATDWLDNNIQEWRELFDFTNRD